ncbi:MAG: CPBP family intramembrane metalloprotease [Oscillospiraceae bacterium]|nr:CPBP family intramembrane metalloprotease [Oscillospiraceae bacterium]
MSDTAKSKRIPALILYAVLFYTVWALWALVIRPPLKEAMDDSLLFELLSSCFKTLVWTVPALLLIKAFEPEMQVGLRQMFTEKVPLKAILLWTLIFVIFGGGTLFRGILHGTLHINPEFSLKSNQWLLIVGISEETVFRGWFLNATAKDDKDWKPIALNAVMFLCIHFPGWIQKGMLLQAFTGFGFFTILLFSVLVSVCFLKHKNLLLPVFLHMLYDFLLEFFAA